MGNEKATGLVGNDIPENKNGCILGLNYDMSICLVSLAVSRAM